MQIVRYVTNPRATIGKVPSLSLFSLENPWRGNGKDSSIPAGKYRCVRVVSPKFGDTFEITNVPQRSKILFHAGNTEKDTLGCILLGMSTDNAASIGHSRAAFQKFMLRYSGVDEFDLEITEQYPI